MSFRFNPITGKLDLVGSAATPKADNFSYSLIPDGSSVTIPAGQHMLYRDLRVLGALHVDGAIYEAAQDSLEFSWTEIVEGQVVVVPSNRELFVSPGFVVRGDLRVTGRMREI